MMAANTKPPLKGPTSRTDFAVLKIEEKDLPYLAFGDSDVLKVGEWVVAIGNPFGLEGTSPSASSAQKGAKISASPPTKTSSKPMRPSTPAIRAALSSISKAKSSASTQPSTAAAAATWALASPFPARWPKTSSSKSSKKALVKRAYLGIVLQPVDKELSDAMGLEKQEGILISEVVKDSPAAKAGLQQGDIILQYNDKPIKNVTKFRNDMAMMNPGSTIKL